MSTSGKNPDLIWFEYETRMRKLVQELLEPTIKRSIQDREIYEQLNKKFDEQKRRMDEIEFIMHKTQKRQTIFDEINKRINDLDNARKLEERNITMEIETVKKLFEGVNLEQKKTFEQIKSIDKLANQISFDFSKTNEVLQGFRDTITTSVENIQQEVIKNGNDMRLSIVQFEEKFMKIQDILGEHTITLGNHDIIVSSAKNSVSEMNTKMNTFEKNLEDIKGKMQIFSKAIETLKLVNNKVEEVEQKHKATSHFVDKYLPISIQAQISDTLMFCLAVGNRKKLRIYEEQKFNDFNSIILNDDGISRLDKKKNELNDFLEKFCKRNPNYKTRGNRRNMDASYTGASGSRAQSRQNPSNDGADLDAKLPHGDISGLNSADEGELDDDEEMDRDILKISSDLNGLKDQIFNEVKNIKQDLKEKLIKLTKDQMENTENVNLMIKSNNDEMERYFLKLKKEKAENVAELKILDNKINRLYESDQKIFNYLKFLSEQFATSIETINSLIAIGLKEDEDRGSNQRNQDEDQLKVQIRKKGQELPVIGPSSRLKTEENAYEQEGVKISYNGKVVSKYEFLQIAFENFRDCLTFALKFRNNPNFLNFFELQNRKASPIKPNTSQSLRRGLSLSNNKEDRKLINLTGKSSISKLNRIINNYNSPSITPILQDGKNPDKANPNRNLFAEEMDNKINFHNNSNNLNLSSLN